MLMAATAAATHVGGSAHSSSSSISPPPPPPWHPVVLVPSDQQQHQVLSYHHDLATPSPSPSPTTPAAASPPPPPRPRHNHLRPTARRAGKQQRRPRPSRKLPTTYISADAASFRRMVHQVTGADDVVHQATVEFLCRPAPPSSRAALTTTTATLLLPTLDTSAFLLGATARGAGTPAGPGATCRLGSVVAVGDPGAALQAEEAACGRGGVRRGGGGGGGGEHSCSNGGSAGGGGGFPSLESWDA